MATVQRVAPGPGCRAVRWHGAWGLSWAQVLEARAGSAPWAWALCSCQTSSGLDMTELDL